MVRKSGLSAYEIKNIAICDVTINGWAAKKRVSCTLVVLTVSHNANFIKNTLAIIENFILMGAKSILT